MRLPKLTGLYGLSILRAEFVPKYDDSREKQQVRAIWRWDCKSVTPSTLISQPSKCTPSCWRMGAVGWVARAS